MYVCFPPFNSAGSGTYPNALVAETSTQTLTNKTLSSPTLTGNVDISNVNFIGDIVTFDDGLFIKESSESYGGIIRFWNNDNSKYIHFQPAPATIHPPLNQGHLELIVTIMCLFVSPI